MMQLTVPATLEFRDMAVRVVAAASKLAGGGRRHFDEGVVSAFGEAFNNVVIHGRVQPPQDLRIEIELPENAMVIRIVFAGPVFDPTRLDARTLPDPLAESGRGLFIMHAYMDELSYTPATATSPNVLCMIKRFRPSRREAAA